MKGKSTGRRPDRRGDVQETIETSGCRAFEETLVALMEGELAEENEKRVRNHLEQCDSCLLRYRQLVETVGLLGEVELEELPRGLDERISAALSEMGPPEAARQGGNETRRARAPLPAASEKQPSGSWVERVGLLLAGAAAAMLLGLGLWTVSSRDTDVTPESEPERKVAQPVERKPKTSVPDLGSLEASRVALLTLTVESSEPVEEVTVRVVLPEGLGFAGPEGAFPERMVTWTSRLRTGDNLIKLPVKALRPGRLELTARVEGEGFEEVVRGAVRVRALGSGRRKPSAVQWRGG
jgi:hypothetical protein